MKKKIPIRIDWTEDPDGKGSIEITMSLEHFETSGASIRENIRSFKKAYLDAVNEAKKIDQDAKRRNKKKTKEVPTKQRWLACKILADFNNRFENLFDIRNYKEAYSRDFNLPMRSIRTYLDFGTYFKEDEILDDIPYSTYVELTFVINALKRKKLFEAEKNKLIQMARDKKLPNRDEYRMHLRQLMK